MNRPLLPRLRIARAGVIVAIAIAIAIAGVAAAVVASGGAAGAASGRTTPLGAPGPTAVTVAGGTVMAVPAAPTEPPVVVTAAMAAPVPAAAVVQSVPAPLPACRRNPRSSAKQPPASDAVKNAFGVLRRERRDEDALPAKALAALDARGLRPADPQAARMLRDDGDGRAWIVPVGDVDAGGLFGCAPGATRKAREGVAVIAVGDAAVGGGGALADLQRGLAPATVDPCTGTGGASGTVSVSGVVPDGVEAVFVTAADGTATRADVRENGYAFVLPLTARPESRYLVWTGANGTPHVQPLPIGMRRPGSRAPRCPRFELPPRVTPNAFAVGCAPPPFAAAPGRPAVREPRRALRSRRARPRVPRLLPTPRRIPAPPPFAIGCAAAVGLPFVVSAAPAALPVPAAPGRPRPPRTP